VTWGPVGDLTLADPDDYVLNLDVEPAEVLLKSPLVPMIPSKSVQFQFTAGYSDDPDDVPMPIKSGILLLTAYLYEGRGDVNSQGPDAAWAIMTPYRLWQLAG
jgi:uncharacterized phiE125 gp8 family phage protein